MDIILFLAFKLIPLYLLVVLGFIATNLVKVNKNSVSRLVIYTITPFVVFYGTYKSDISWSTMTIPLIWYVVAIIISFLFYFISKIVWGSSSVNKNLMGMMCGTSNTGYFGIPVALILFGDQAFSFCVFIVMGNILFEYTFGYYIIARGKHSINDSLKKLIKLPSIYVFFLAIILNKSGIVLNNTITNSLELFKGAYSILGIMIIGMGLSLNVFKKIDFKMLSISLFAKFIVWPTMIFGIILLDIHCFHLINNNICYKTMTLISLVPLAANTVAFSTELKIYPEKVAFIVLISTLLAIFFIPIGLSFFSL